MVSFAIGFATDPGGVGSICAAFFGLRGDGDGCRSRLERSWVAYIAERARRAEISFVGSRGAFAFTEDGC